MGHFDAVKILDGRALVENALHPAGIPRLVGPRSPGADPERMRAVPIIGRGVGGAIRGTSPHGRSRIGKARHGNGFRPPEVSLPPPRSRAREDLEAELGDMGIAGIDGLTVLRSCCTVTVQRIGESELAHAGRHRRRVREALGWPHATSWSLAA